MKYNILVSPEEMFSMSALIPSNNYECTVSTPSTGEVQLTWSTTTENSEHFGNYRVFSDEKRCVIAIWKMTWTDFGAFICDQDGKYDSKTQQQALDILRQMAEECDKIGATCILLLEGRHSERIKHKRGGVHEYEIVKSAYEAMYKHKIHLWWAQNKMGTFQKIQEAILNHAAVFGPSQTPTIPKAMKKKKRRRILSDEERDVPQDSSFPHITEVKVIQSEDSDHSPSSQPPTRFPDPLGNVVSVLGKNKSFKMKQKKPKVQIQRSLAHQLLTSVDRIGDGTAQKILCKYSIADLMKMEPSLLMNLRIRSARQDIGECLTCLFHNDSELKRALASIKHIDEEHAEEALQYLKKLAHSPDVEQPPSNQQPPELVWQNIVRGLTFFKAVPNKDSS